MLIGKRGSTCDACLLLCVSALAVINVSSSIAKEPNKKATTSESTQKLDTTTGFRGQKFGTEFSQFQGLTLEKDTGDLKLYIKKDENLQLGPVKLTTIVYHFFQDKFFGVSLHTENRDNTLGLLRVAIAAFGQGDQSSNAKDELDRSWDGKSVEAFFNVNPKTEEGSLLIQDNQLAAQVEEYREKLTKEAANDL
jgi:hypothetical protein